MMGRAGRYMPLWKLSAKALPELLKRQELGKCGLIYKGAAAE